MVVTSEAQGLGTCERLAQGRCPALRRPGVEPETCWSQVQYLSHYATEPHVGCVARLLGRVVKSMRCLCLSLECSCSCHLLSEVIPCVVCLLPISCCVGKTCSRLQLPCSGQWWVITLHPSEAAAQCIVIAPVSLCVCGSVTTMTRNCVHRSSPNWICR